MAGADGGGLQDSSISIFIVHTSPHVSSTVARVRLNIPIIRNAGLPCEAAPRAPAPALDAAPAALSPAAALGFSLMLSMHEADAG